eukprot:CCRYP_001703-RC/>CCRYP_001703-RC protein AED:0.47 eAED:1.00 QI:0/0/0/1/0/0/2/0/122
MRVDSTMAGGKLFRLFLGVASFDFEREMEAVATDADALEVIVRRRVDLRDPTLLSLTSDALLTSSDRFDLRERVDRGEGRFSNTSISSPLATTSSDPSSLTLCFLESSLTPSFFRLRSAAHC